MSEFANSFPISPMTTSGKHHRHLPNPQVGRAFGQVRSTPVESGYRRRSPSRSGALVRYHSKFSCSSFSHVFVLSYRKVLAHFHPDIKHPDPLFAPPSPPHRIPIVGFSATFSRHDGLALGSIFERIVYHRDFLEMIKEQWYL